MIQTCRIYYRSVKYYQPYFTNKSVKIPLNFLQGKNVHLAKMAPRRRRVCAGGHVTGYFTGGSREGLESARQTQCCSRIIHLAKLNPNCHMNYLDYL